MSCWNKEQLENMLYAVVDALNLSDIAIERYGPEGTAPAELVRLILGQKDTEIDLLRRGFVGVRPSQRDVEIARLPVESKGEPLRESVQWFAGEMERKLKANDHKGGWSGIDPSSLVSRLMEETMELLDAIHATTVRVPESLISEAADVANFAMMVADNARLARPVETKEGER